MIIYNQREEREEKKMAKREKTRGFYEFADGTTAWFYGLSAAEKRALIREHGAIVRFVQTD